MPKSVWNIVASLVTALTTLSLFSFIAQFTLISEKKVVNQDDYTFPSIEVSSMSDCAKVCVEYSSFTCNSFDYCEKNPNPCKISKAHVGDGKTVLMNSTCDHFSSKPI